MDCAEEVALLRRELGGRPGVRELWFDVARSKLVVAHDPAVISAREIEATIARSGMSSEVWTSQLDQPPSFYERHHRAIATALSGVCLVMASLIGLSQSDGTLWTWLAHDGGHHGSGWVVAFQMLAILFGFGPSVPKLSSSIRALRMDMPVLMAVSLGGAAFLREWSEGGALAFLFSLAGLLETWSMRKAQSSVAALLDITPAEATVLHHGHEHRVPASRLEVGQLVRIKPGERIPCDGEVVTGESAVDQAIITGEAASVAKVSGDQVFAGTLNGTGVLEVRTTTAASGTALARIVRMVEGSHHRRAPSEQFVERFARYYTPVILALAIGVADLPPLLMGLEPARWFYQGMVVLLISCPCALVVSTPITIVSALSSAARRGVLVKGGAFLEVAAHLRAVAFDKTGVLTRGEPRVETFRPLNGKSAKEILVSLAGLELRSEHPLGAAIVAFARDQGVQPAEVTGFQALSGRGAEALIGGETFWAGSRRLLEEKQLSGVDTVGQLESLEDSRHTAILCGANREVWALIGLTDPIRAEARAAINQLRGLGVAEIAILTGDNRVTAAAVGKELGIANVHSELLPAQKLASVEEMRGKFGIVAMVGDGINDAPAMAAASLGVALAGRSTDLALETADIVLASADLRKLPFLIRHARRAVRVIRQNVWIAIGLKVAFLAMAMLGTATLWMAIVADMGATVLVTLNGLRLLQAEDASEGTR